MCMKEMKKTAEKNHPDNHAIPGLKAKRSSAGLGLYTDLAIAKGTRIIEYIGNRIPVSSENTNKYILTSTKKLISTGARAGILLVMLIIAVAQTVRRSMIVAVSL